MFRAVASYFGGNTMSASPTTQTKMAVRSNVRTSKDYTDANEVDTEEKEEEEDNGEEEEEEDNEENETIGGTKQRADTSIESERYIRSRIRKIKTWWCRNVTSHTDTIFMAECVVGNALLYVYNVSSDICLSDLETAIVNAPRCIQDIVFHMPDEDKHDAEPHVTIHFDAHRRQTAGKTPRVLSVTQVAAKLAGSLVPRFAKSAAEDDEDDDADDDDDDTEEEDDNASIRYRCTERHIINKEWNAKNEADSLRVRTLTTKLLAGKVISPLSPNMHEIIQKMSCGDGTLPDGNSLYVGVVCDHIAKMYKHMSPINLTMHGKLTHDPANPHRTRIVITITRMQAVSIKTLREIVQIQPTAIEDIVIGLRAKTMKIVVFPVELTAISPFKWMRFVDCYTTNSLGVMRRERSRYAVHTPYTSIPAKRRVSAKPPATIAAASPSSYSSSSSTLSSSMQQNSAAASTSTKTQQQQQPSSASTTSAMMEAAKNAAAARAVAASFKANFLSAPQPRAPTVTSQLKATTQSHANVTNPFPTTQPKQSRHQQLFDIAPLAFAPSTASLPTRVQSQYADGSSGKLRNHQRVNHKYDAPASAAFKYKNTNSYV